MHQLSTLQWCLDSKEAQASVSIHSKGPGRKKAGIEVHMQLEGNKLQRKISGKFFFIMFKCFASVVTAA